MANYANLKATIAANVYPNGNEEITALMVRTSEYAIVDALENVDNRTTGKFYGFYNTAGDLPAGDDDGFAYVGASAPYSVWVFKEGAWSDSGAIYSYPIGNGEDIDFNGDGEFEFADRPAGNGMGYKILRMSASLASQITEQDTIYEIRYDFDLGGSSISIPAGCILRFIGGSIHNGTISGQYTRIEAADYKIFDGVDLAGDFIGGVRVTWFGAVGDGVTDCTSAFQAAIDSSADIYIPPGTYMISSTITSTDHSIYLHGGGRSSIITSTSAVPFFSLNNPVVDGASVGIVVQHLAFHGDDGGGQIALSLGGVTEFALNVHISDCYFRHIHTGVELNHEADNITIDACHFMWNTYGVKRNNISTNSSGVRIINSEFQMGYSSGRSVDFSTGNNLTICDCIFQATNRTNLTFINIEYTNSIDVCRNYFEISTSADSSQNYAMSFTACSQTRISKWRTQGFLAYLIKIGNPNWNVEIDLGSISYSSINSSALTGTIYNSLPDTVSRRLEIHPYAALLSGTTINSFNAVGFSRGETIYSISNKFISKNGGTFEIDLSDFAKILRGIRMAWMDRNTKFTGEQIIFLSDVGNVSGYLDAGANGVSWLYDYMTRKMTITNNRVVNGTPANIELYIGISIPFIDGVLPR